MSALARADLVSSPRTFFQAESQRSDLMNPGLTQTGLIALLSALVGAGWALEFTAINTDHHDDSALGTYCHCNGYCADLWPLYRAQAGAYLDPTSDAFAHFLNEVAASPYLHQIGLAGSADTPRNRVAAGPTVFSDDGGDHIHIGAHN